MQQFEYKTLTVPLKSTLFSKKIDLDMELIEDELNLLGRMGWELTTQFTRQKNGFSQYAVLILKRPIVLHASKNKS
ncbi:MULTISPECIES: DUF4177 domain-containing protein [unclassified Aureispira]|uniref:DUF4177 domain-containing protein n=1 Tax=unclassified Aureispira TaxID=2649989 RepID=UPI000696D336|nr:MULTISPECIES: DUF4177 domain-containing protein [unclassified Aureispira]WMX17339.1 DUF4177 domain-containing protein [Aureispira sp. CCB-E]